jgi:hypothetical protein
MGTTVLYGTYSTSCKKRVGSPGPYGYPVDRRAARAGTQFTIAFTQKVTQYHVGSAQLVDTANPNWATTG